MKNSFRLFAETAQLIADTRSNLEKAHLCARYLSSLPSLADQKLAIRFFGEGALPSLHARNLSIGHKTIAEAACAFMGIDYEYVFKTCRTATGSSSETIEKLMEAWPNAVAKRSPEWIPLKEIATFFEDLTELKHKEQKIARLHEMWARLTPVEIKFAIRIMHRYSLRIGFEVRSILKALSLAFDQSVEDLRYAHMLTGSLEKTVELSLKNNLNKVGFTYFKPLSFMLASPLHTVNLTDFSEFICEEKFDGMRCQAHIYKHEVKLFSRDLNDITPTFPELNDFFLTRKLPDCVLDGEIIVYKDDEILPFQVLQKRMGVKKPSKTLLEEFPVAFIAYDVLVLESNLIIQHPFRLRRENLEELSSQYQLPISLTYPIETFDDIKERFAIAREHGNEGLMLKKRESTYEFGQRGNQWIKVKEPAGSLDTVLLYAHAGSGKRGGYYSDFTLGVRDDAKQKHHEPYFVPIGKAYGGYTDEQLRWLNKEIKGLILDKFGPTLGLKPQIVIELEFEEIQINKRTKAGYTLRLPRFKAIRHDLSLRDVDSVEDVKRLYEAQLHRKRLKNFIEPFLVFPKLSRTES
jgi:DNA ligase-1